jgi:hypothetical protein
VILYHLQRVGVATLSLVHSGEVKAMIHEDMNARNLMPPNNHPQIGEEAQGLQL